MVVPNHHSIPNILSPSSFSGADAVELRPIKTSGVHRYSSLRDLLPPSPVKSPAPPARQDIRIRNRLVEQAARAYLSPTSTTPDFADASFCQGLLSCFATLLDFFCGSFVQALAGTLRAVRLRITRPQQRSHDVLFE